jgi:glycosidase
LNKRLAFFEKDFIEKDQTDFIDFYSQLAALKKKHPQLHLAKDVRFSIINSSNTNVVVLKRTKNEKSMYFIANLTEKEQAIETPITGSFISLMDDTEFLLKDSIKLAPWEYHFLNQ